MGRQPRNQRVADLYKRMDRQSRLRTKLINLNILDNRDRLYGRYAKIDRRRSEMEEIKREMQRLRRLNEYTEWMEHQEKTGEVISLAAFRNSLRFPRNAYRPLPPRAA